MAPRRPANARSHRSSGYLTQEEVSSPFRLFEQVAELPEVFQLLGDPSRRRILYACFDERRSAGKSRLTAAR